MSHSTRGGFVIFAYKVLKRLLSPFLEASGSRPHVLQTWFWERRLCLPTSYASTPEHDRKGLISKRRTVRTLAYSVSKISWTNLELLKRATVQKAEKELYHMWLTYKYVRHISCPSPFLSFPPHNHFFFPLRTEINQLKVQSDV